MHNMPAFPASRADLEQGLAAAPAVLVTVVKTQGSTPREPGAWLALFANCQLGSIGGGQLELQVLKAAGELLQVGPSHFLNGQIRRQALGPSLGQCCGGVVELRFDFLPDPDTLHALAVAETGQDPVAIFGAGHVGQALVRTLLPLPFALRWIDSRDGIFPSGLPACVQTEQSDPVQLAVPELLPGSRVLIMSFSHIEDFELVAACLRRLRASDDLPFVGLIGSQSKWASFRQRLLARGFAPAELARVNCPIGLPGITGKQPAVIAASVAAQLLQLSQVFPKGPIIKS
jgi:xanthine dehydrogenase accessory factor